MVGLYSDSMSSVLAEGDAIPADRPYCKSFEFSESGGSLYGVNCAEVSACVLDDSQCVPRPVVVGTSLPRHVLYGLSGIATYVLSKLCGFRKKKKKANGSDGPPDGPSFVARAHFTADHLSSTVAYPNPVEDPVATTRAPAPVGERRTVILPHSPHSRLWRIPIGTENHRAASQIDSTPPSSRPQRALHNWRQNTRNTVRRPYPCPRRDST